MKIGIFTDSYRPYTSGVVNSIELFTRDLTGLGHEVNIFAPSYRNNDEDNKVFRFVSVPAPTNREFSLAIPFSLRLRPAMKKAQAGYHTRALTFFTGQAGGQICQDA